MACGDNAQATVDASINGTPDSSQPLPDALATIYDAATIDAALIDAAAGVDAAMFDGAVPDAMVAFDASAPDAPPPAIDAPPAPIDAPPPSPDALVCSPLSLAGVPAATLTRVTTVTPNGTGGTITSGAWRLSELRYQLFVTISGTVVGLVDLGATGATSGNAQGHVTANITNPITTSVDETAQGPYATAGNLFTLTEACTGGLTLANAQYTASPTQLTVWTTLVVSGINVPAELRFVPL